MNPALDTGRHPCFNEAAKGSFGRVHLPVAPRCNIKCNYCNRRYDCVNESRPGVTSAVLAPAQAVRYIERVLEKEPRISVAGIAGPGDPFANPVETMETLRLIRKRFPEMLMCLSTNGLGILPYVEEIARLEVTHVTITVNAVDPEIGQRIYSWVRDGNVVYRGKKGAELLLSRQLEAIARLKELGVTVKVNTIIIPGINDHHVSVVAQRMKELGVDILNCMAMYPNADTPFQDIPEPDCDLMRDIRNEAEAHLPQMRHCTRCRADAVGLLGEDRSGELHSCLSECSTLPPFDEEERPYVAVATYEGVLVNLHLGEAEELQIWEKAGDEFRLAETRKAPKSGSGPNRWAELAELLHDCRALLASAMGESPRNTLNNAGIITVEMNGFINEGLKALYGNGDLSRLKGRRKGVAAGGCKGSGGGCL